MSHRSASTLDRLAVSDAMHPQILVCAAGTPLAQVAQMMAAEQVHRVVVEGTGPDASGWGIVSDLDVVAAGVGGRASEAAAATAAKDFLTVSADEKLSEAARLMVEHDASHLIVVHPRLARALGVLSTLHVASVIAATHLAT